MPGDRGVVLEVSGKSALVLTNNGDLLSVPLGRRAVAVGDEMPLTPEPVVQRSWTIWDTGLAAAAAVLLFIGLALPRLLPAANMATISIDINPSAELRVDSAGRVREVLLLNNEAQLLFGSADLVRRDLSEALSLLVTGAADAGYLPPDGSGFVMLTYVPGDGDLQPALTAWEQQFQSERPVDVVLRTADPALLERARANGLSVGEQLALEIGLEHSAALDLEQFRAGSIASVYQSAGLDLGLLRGPEDAPLPPANVMPAATQPPAPVTTPPPVPADHEADDKGEKDDDRPDDHEEHEDDEKPHKGRG